MFDIGWIELLVIFVLVLVVLGPARLPEVARTLGLWFGRLRRTYNNFKLEIEREVGMDEVRRQLHNEQIMSEMKAIEEETKSILDESKVVDSSITDAAQSAVDAANQHSTEEPSKSDESDAKLQEENRG